jgi:hypothetical protein
MLRKIYKLYHPDIYQGSRRKKKYFEGWYFKIVNDEETLALAFIPGVSIGREEPDHAFIQVLDGRNAKSYYYSFSSDEFEADKKELKLKIGNNFFSKAAIHLDLPEFHGKITMENHISIPTNVFSPGIMGWYSFTPFMQCYHGVVSMYHKVEGSLTCLGSAYDFKNGVGYIEKDWGTSFPRCWIWSHCNHFDHNTPVSLMASVAHIPWMGSYFIGFIVALLFEGQVKIFATYNNSKMKVAINDHGAAMEFKKNDTVLTLECTPGAGADLKSPIEGIMKGKVNESLQASINLTLQTKNQIITLKGRNAGLEIAGETEILESSKWRN